MEPRQARFGQQGRQTWALAGVLVLAVLAVVAVVVLAGG
jgi:hypothetical protein